MELLNEMYDARQKGVVGTAVWDEAIDIYLRMMAPVTPHIAEELWMSIGRPYSIHQQPWPKYDEEAAAEEIITLAIQVNGKVRDRITFRADAGEGEIKQAALSSEIIQQYLGGGEPQKVIIVPGRLVNIVL